VVVLRQRGSVLAGWLGMLVLGGVLVGLLVSGSLWSSLGLTVLLVLLLGLTWVLVLRPAVAIEPRGVVLHNPFRRTYLPWEVIEGTGSRWMLEVHTAQRRYASWAISSSLTRPSQWVIESYRRGPGERTSRVTAANASALIDEHREAYAAAQHPAPKAAVVQTAWNRLELLAVGLPAVLLALTLLI
ncbi:MAG TPA: PH domain-containing protein, partial [Candidatus Lustribacter sp.]|nr:PH domain-containing protein [Candidatus Lustribacter sp.]